MKSRKQLLCGDAKGQHRYRDKLLSVCSRTNNTSRTTQQPIPKSKNPWNHHSTESVSPWNACSYLPWWPPVSWSPASGRAGAWKSAPGPGARSVSPSPKVFPAWNFSSGGGSGSSELWWERCSSYPWGNWERECHTVRREQNTPGVLLQGSKRNQIPPGFSSG